MTLIRIKEKDKINKEEKIKTKIGQVMILNQEITDETGNLPNLKNIHPVEIIEKNSGCNIWIFGQQKNGKSFYLKTVVKDFAHVLIKIFLWK